MELIKGQGQGKRREKGKPKTPKSPKAGESVEEKEGNLSASISSALTSLNLEEAEIIREKYGFNDGLMKSSEEVAQSLNEKSDGDRKTAADVRELTAKALRKLMGY